MYCARAKKLQLELQLASIGHRVDEKQLVQKILMGLSKCFETVRDIILFQGNLNLFHVAAKLRVVESCMTLKNRIEATDSVVRSAEKNKQEMNEKKMRCFGCGQRGHVKNNCTNYKMQNRQEAGGASVGSRTPNHLYLYANCNNRWA